MLLFCLLLTAPAAAQVLYVDQLATGAGDGSSWDDAYNTIYDAVAAAQSGDEIWVAAGSYTPGPSGQPLQLKDGVALYGGFSGDETQRDQRYPNPAYYTTRYHTTISGGSGYPHLIDGSGVSRTARLDGFQLDGLGETRVVYISGGSPTFANTVIQQGSADTGGGLYYEGDDGSSPLFVNTIFAYNTASEGGAAWLATTDIEEAPEPEFVNTTFAENSSTGTGFGPGRGGAVVVSGALPAFINCAFLDNTSADDGSVLFSDNVPLHNDHFSNDDRYRIVNAIFHGNTGGVPIRINTSDNDHGPQPEVTYSLFPDTSYPFADHNITGDPMLQASSGTDYLLVEVEDNSPVIDAGADAALPIDAADLDHDGNTAEAIPYDLDREPRVVGNGVDIGPNEYEAERAVRGWVHDATTSEGVAGAVVALQNTPYETTTDAAGDFQFIEEVPAGTYTFVVTKEGYESVTRSNTISETTISVNFSIYPLDTLQGKVTDAATDAALAGATVTLEGAGRQTTTDADGRYVFANLPIHTGEVYTLKVTKAGYHPFSDFYVTNPGTHTVDVALQPAGAVVAGTVTDEITGSPLEGATVEIDGTAFSTTTDQNGAYRFEDVPKEQLYDLTATLDGYETGTHRLYLGDVEHASVDITLLPAAGTVAGAVQNAATNAPLTGYDLALVNEANSACSNEVTGAAQQTYSLDVPAGVYTLTASREGYKAYETTVFVAAGATTTHDVPLVPEHLFVVTETHDGTYGGSLRKALMDANASANTDGPEEIVFNIPGPGPHLIRPEYPLPAVTDPVVIDGTTEPDYNGQQPNVMLDGLFLQFIDKPGIDPNNLLSGLVTEAPGNTTIRGLSILQFPDGAVAAMSGAATIQQNVIAQNGEAGLLVMGSDVVVGGAAGRGNLIAQNRGPGVAVGGGAAGTTVTHNYMFGNTGPGIDLGFDGPTANDAGDADGGPNRLQNHPVLAGYTYDDQTHEVTVTYAVPTATANAAYPLTVAFYQASLGGQGRALLAEATYTAAEAQTQQTLTFTPPAGFTADDGLIATATDADGNTSEFSPFQTTHAFSFDSGDPSRVDFDPFDIGIDLDPAGGSGKTGTVVAASASQQVVLTVTRSNGIPEGGVAAGLAQAVPGYWTITQASGTAAFTAEVCFELDTLAVPREQVTFAQLQVHKRADVHDTWTPQTVALHPNATSPTEICATGVTSFSQFVVVADPQALPVELAAFEAVADGEAAVLTWQTASEVDNAGFEVEMRRRATRGGASLQEAPWQALGFVEGHGTTTEVQQYTYRAEGLAPGRYRFRLKQVDYDGTFTYSPEVEATVAAPEAFALQGNYPNPFNPSTTIRYEMAAPAHVRLVVFDVLGREVAVLVDGHREAGRHTARFEAGALPSGTYFYRIEAGAFAETRRMLLVK